MSSSAFAAPSAQHGTLGLERQPSRSPRHFSDKALPEDAYIRISGRGSTRPAVYKKLPENDGFDSMQFGCPQGCKLEGCSRERGHSSCTVHVRVRKQRSTPSVFRLTAAEDTANAACPGCDRHLQMKIMDEETKNRECSSQRDAGGGEAYMAVLWFPDAEKSRYTRSQKHVEELRAEGCRKYITDALILGSSLAYRCQDKRRVLLVTQDVMDMPESNLLRIFWELRVIRHVEVHPNRIRLTEQRFTRVFTKLRALEQTDFSKIVLLDLDIVVARAVDELFAFSPPAALFRGNTPSRAGSQRSGETLFSKKTGAQQGGINAGVMVLQPSTAHFEHMQGQLSRRGECTRAPEQNFLSTCDLYADNWSGLHVKYNFQPHQLRYLQDQGITECERKMPISEVSIFHYSGKHSPRDFLFEAFRRQWYSESFQLFSDELVKAWGQGKVTAEDFQRMKEAVDHWHAEFTRMWTVVLNMVAGAQLVCPVCLEGGSQNPEHAFLLCRPLDPQRKEWKADHRCDNESPDGRVRWGFEMLMCPTLFPATLRFVAIVQGFRHPEGLELDYRLLDASIASDCDVQTFRELSARLRRPVGNDDVDAGAPRGLGGGIRDKGTRGRGKYAGRGEMRHRNLKTPKRQRSDFEAHYSTVDDQRKGFGKGKRQRNFKGTLTCAHSAPAVPRPPGGPPPPHLLAQHHNRPIHSPTATPSAIPYPVICRLLRPANVVNFNENPTCAPSAPAVARPPGEPPPPYLLPQPRTR